MTVALIAGLVAGIALVYFTRKYGVVAAWTAIVLGAIADLLLVGSLGGWLLPDLGRVGILGVGLLSGVATALAIGALARGERKPLNWVALVVATPPVLFLVVFGLGEVLGSPH